MTSKSAQDTAEARLLRVLVVDNKLIDRTDHAEDLKEWGYTPIVAEGAGKALIEDAKRKARENRCHAAIVDMRLFDDHDVSDRSGLELVPHLMPAKCIIVTGYGTVSKSREANEYGAVMVGKEEGPDAVRVELETALQDVRRTDFVIEPTDFLEEHVVPHLRSDTRQPVQADEVRDVLAMLFPQARSVHLQILSGGVPSTPTSTSNGLHSSSVVVRVKPDRLASSIVKFASPGDIKRERENYEKYILERFENRRHPQMSNRKRFWNVGAIVYSFLGEDINDIAQFRAYYRKHSTEEIAAALRNFFRGLWQPLYAERSDLEDSLFVAYDRLWSRPGNVGHLAARLEDWKKLDKLWSFDGLPGQFPDPRHWLADHHRDSLLSDARGCIVHGDLHSENFFVDRHGNTWVIDFERTGYGHVLADAVELEHDILRQLASTLDLPTLYRLLIGLTVPLSITVTSSDDPFSFAQTIPALVQTVQKSRQADVKKALTSIHELRKIAVEVFQYKDQREYYWALLLDTLFGVQRLERQEKLGADDEAIRQGELLIGSVLCQRLKMGQSEVWPPQQWVQLGQSPHDPASIIHNTEGADVNPPQTNAAIGIFFLAANPSDTARLQIDKEYRGIREALQKAGQRERFTLSVELAVRVGELIQLLLQKKATIVHFSGHGSEAGEIILEDESGDSFPLPQEAVQRIFGVLNRNGNQIRCVILNACFTEQQARYIAEYVDIVVGIEAEIVDTSAIKFASVFYASLGEGASVQTAFDLACANIDLHGLDSQDALRLVTKTGINPDTYFLV